MKKIVMLLVVLGWVAAIILCLRPELALRIKMWLSGVKQPDMQNPRKGGIILLPGGNDGQKEESSEQDVEGTDKTSEGDPRSGPGPPLR